jgi:predicted dehydrogenase
MKILIIGCGAISEQFHIPASVELFSKENIFIVDLNNSRLEYIANAFSIDNKSLNYLDYLKIVDYVIIATPPHTHLNILKDCVRYNKPVLCEKPVVMKTEEIKKLSIINDNFAKLICVCHTYRLFNSRKKLKNILQSAFFVDNFSINIEEGDADVWKTQTGYNFCSNLIHGGVLLDAGIHSLDFIFWVLGEPQKYQYMDDSIGGLESNVKILMQFKNNISVNFKLSRTCNLSNKIKVLKEDVEVSIDIFDMNRIETNTNIFDSFISDLDPNMTWKDVAIEQLKSFINAYKEGSIFFANLNDGYIVVDFINDCYNSRKNRVVPIKVPIPGVCY